MEPGKGIQRKITPCAPICDLIQSKSSLFIGYTGHRNPRVRSPARSEKCPHGAWLRVWTVPGDSFKEPTHHRQPREGPGKPLSTHPQQLRERLCSPTM